ncbi:MAG: ATP-binding protein [Bacillota bacterium]|jgi:MinD superfamily P-loop ATPase|nr:4Fe-4S binding protein [Clostridia bacterium]
MQLIILSGKGGTGKTTITASFAYLQKEGVKVDCDVEASNLHIILQGTNEEEHDFFGAKVAKIDSAKCIKCEACKYVCRFDAISEFKVDELKCEGCAACTVVCPKKAISLYDEVTGKTIITETDYGILSHADMEIGAEGSGKLVTELRKNAARFTGEGELVLLDGSPGVGCPVMASLTGCDAALLVVEPTQSGLVDFLRVLELVRFFKIKPYVCINKYDLNYIITRQIYRTCWKEKVPILGEIPFDPMVKQAVNELKPVVVYPESSAGRQINMLWNRLQMKLKEDN